MRQWGIGSVVFDVVADMEGQQSLSSFLCDIVPYGLFHSIAWATVHHLEEKLRRSDVLFVNSDSGCVNKNLSSKI